MVSDCMFTLSIHSCFGLQSLWGIKRFELGVTKHDEPTRFICLANLA